MLNAITYMRQCTMYVQYFLQTLIVDRSTAVFVYPANGCICFSQFYCFKKPNTEQNKKLIIQVLLRNLPIFTYSIQI